jgi:hypothetical protein
MQCHAVPYIAMQCHYFEVAGDTTNFLGVHRLYHPMSSLANGISINLTNVMQCHAMPCSAMLFHEVQCIAMHCHEVLRSAMQFHYLAMATDKPLQYVPANGYPS